MSARTGFTVTFHLLSAAAALGLAALTACQSTPRAHPRLPAGLGAVLTLALLALAIAVLSRPWGLAVAVASALAGLMAAIPAVSAFIAWRQHHAKARHGT